jgi:hypothetical protein
MSALADALLTNNNVVTLQLANCNINTGMLIDLTVFPPSDRSWKKVCRSLKAKQNFSKT